MEAHSIPEKPQQVPFHLALLIETEEEAKALFALFNHSDGPAKHLLGPTIQTKIREALGSRWHTLGARTIARGISYDRYYGCDGVGASKNEP